MTAQFMGISSPAALQFSCLDWEGSGCPTAENISNTVGTQVQLQRPSIYAFSFSFALVLDPTSIVIGNNRVSPMKSKLQGSTGCNY